MPHRVPEVNVRSSLEQLLGPPLVAKLGGLEQVVVILTALLLVRPSACLDARTGRILQHLQRKGSRE